MHGLLIFLGLKVCTNDIMNNIKVFILSVCVFLSICPLVLSASHSFEEEQLAQDFSNKNPKSVVWLEHSDHRSVANFRPEISPYQRGVAILLHDLEQNLNSAGLIHAIAATLPEYGWATLSLQLPAINENEKKLDFGAYSAELNKRIIAAFTWATKLNPTNTIIVAHGTSAIAVLQQLGKQEISGLAAAVLLSAGSNQIENFKVEFEQLAATRTHILDLYSANDNPILVQQAKDRKQSAQLAGLFRRARSATHTQTRQKPLIYYQKSEFGADHHFHNLETKVAKTIVGWLKRMEQTQK